MVENTPQNALTETVFFILLSMLEPRHGYAVMQNVEGLTKSRVKLGAGTLYGAINTLVEKQWIRSVGETRDSRKKEYVITDLGREILRNELIRLEELLSTGKTEFGGAQR